MDISIGTLLFIEIRKLIMPFGKLEHFVPKSGKILDIGCGHGTFSMLLAKKSLSRKVLGIDPSDTKIKIAKKLGKSIKNIEFKKTYLKSVKNQKFDCITVLDVLYLLPKKEKSLFIKNVKRILNKDGVFILKEIENKKGFINSLIAWEEFLMTKIFNLTHSEHDKTEFPTINEYKNMLLNSGFKSIKLKRISGFLPYPHIFFAAK